MSIEERAIGRALVTGAGGFLGEALVAALRRDGIDVVTSDVAGSASSDAVFQVLDVTDFEQVQRIVTGDAIDTIFHCGAVSGPMLMADRPRDIWHINAGGTLNILEAARLAGVERVIVCSTSEVYGQDCRGIAAEDMRALPDNVYGASKLAAEGAAFGYWREHGVDALALRLSWIYGPGRRTPTTLAALLADAAAGRASVVDVHESLLTHYVHVDDAVAGLLRAAHVRDTGGERVFNITAGMGIAFGGIVDHIRQLLPQAQIALRGPRQPRQGPDGFDQTRARTVLGYAPRVTLQQGLARYLATLNERGPR